MKLYEVRIKDKEIIDYKFISDKLSLPIINSHFFQYSNKIGDVSFREYPRSDHSDYVRIEDSGKTLIYRENDDTYIYVIDIDNEMMCDYKIRIRDSKISNILK